MKFWLGHPVKLFFGENRKVSISKFAFNLFSVPSIWIGLAELALRFWFPDGRLWFFGVFTDLCNDVKFIFIFVIGYGIAAADEHGMKEVIRKGRWYNLIIGEFTGHGEIQCEMLTLIYIQGILVLTIYSGNFFVSEIIEAKFVFFYVRGFAEWLFIIGLYGVLRERVTNTGAWIPVLSEFR